jgi:phosphoesterase RecJ-like protein
MLKDLLTITDDGVAYMILDKEIQEKYQINEGDTEGFVNMPLSIDKVRMSLLLKEDGDRVRVSIRSKKGTSANRCSRLHFNGGGHENAAGGRLNIPADISSINEAGAYVEKHTHINFTEEYES